MTAKEFLNQYRDANREINAKLDQRHRLMELATKTTQVLSERVQTSTENRTEKIVAKIVDLENEIDAAIDELQDIKHKVETVIKKVPDSKQRAVLEHRYINGKHWEEIAVDMHYTYRHVTRLHGEALLAVKDVLLCPIKK